MGIALGAGGHVSISKPQPEIISPESETIRTLDAFTIDNLSQRDYPPGRIDMLEKIGSRENYDTYLISFLSDGAKISGLANIPTGAGKFPVIIQVRGYVDREIYQSGMGTLRSGQRFAENGYLTIAPDFLGYGKSDMPKTNDIFEERFLTYPVVLNLLSSLGSISQADTDRIGLWGHSNGGAISLTVKEILSGARSDLKKYAGIPLTLWAPVSKPFPYSILFYTDEATDSGKFLRSKLAQFEKIYDTDLYSLTSYLDRIQGPIQLHQGENDRYVPTYWSDELKDRLSENDQVELKYFTYPKTDHNLNGSWDAVIARDLEFFNSYL